MSDSEGGSGIGVWNWSDVEGLAPETRAKLDPTFKREQIGRWTESGAKERADNLPVEDSAIALNSTEG